MKYYISDLHYFHRFIEDIDHRGFETEYQMHQYMIKQWNSRVTNNDEVYILGDFSFGNGVQTWDIYNQLNGKKILIEGNHDYWYLDDSEFVDTILEDIRNYHEIVDNKINVVLSHYPIPFYNHQFKVDFNTGEVFTYMLYGHVHNLYDEYLLNCLINKASTTVRESAAYAEVPTPMHMINCFCVFSDYVPLTLEEWIDVDKKRRELINQVEKECGGFIDYKQWEQLNLQIIQKSKLLWKEYNI